MTDQTNPTGQAPETPVQGAGVPDTQTNQVPAVPEPFDADRAMATIKAQREEAKAMKAQLKELETLKAEKKAKEEAEMTELQRLQKQAADLNAERSKLVMDIMKRDVVAETGLPAAFADRLKGSTKEEMTADAQEILKLLPQTQPKQPPTLPATNPNGASTVESEAQRRERLMGTKVNIFDPNNAKENGGGVVWKT